MADQVITRFAPSPTGFLHIGGARTALFNWLYARGAQSDAKSGAPGKFYLRIEDTDRARHNEAAVQAILDGLSWLGITWDGDPVSQFSRRDRHIEVARELLRRDAAYRCFLSPEEIDATRDAALAQKKKFESPWRSESQSAIDAKVDSGAPFTIRFKAPGDGRTSIDDAVQGNVSFPNTALDDLIILRSNGEPTYNLAVVVDDHDMGVTHVIRGDDHLNNAARQQQIYDALGWTPPTFAHAPLIHGPDGAKLSKRHGALGVEAYRDAGYLPETVANALLRMGWSHGDDEIISQENALAWFDVSGINKAPARLDLDKMRALNEHYIANLSVGEFLSRVTPFLDDVAALDDPETKQRLCRAAPFLQPRMTLLSDINAVAAFALLKRPLTITGKAQKPLKKDGAHARLSALHRVLSDHNIWSDAARLDACLQDYADENDLGFGQIGPALRATLTAGHPAPSLGEVLFSLGKDESLARIQDQLVGYEPNHGTP